MVSDGWEGGGVPLERKRKRRGQAETSRPDDDPRPVVQLKAGKLHEAVDDVDRILSAAGPGPIFQWGGQLVRVKQRRARRWDESEEEQDALGIVDPAALRLELARGAYFERWDLRVDGWKPTDPPKSMVESYLARSTWSVEPLRGIVGAPLLRRDGSLLWRRGYDRATGLYLTAELPGVDVPARPSQHQAALAQEQLTYLLKEFPFAERGGVPSEVSLAVATAGVLGALQRPVLPHVPLIGVSAPEAGTGKSHLVDVIAMIATGRRAPTIGGSEDQTEFEKTLTAALIEGWPLLSADNLEIPLRGGLLCRILTEEHTLLRVLGLSKNVQPPVSPALYATGNNLSVTGDACRRVLVCHMEANVARPEEREFTAAPLREAQARRAELVSAALTIMRWGLQNRDPAPPAGRRMASFEEWCRVVRDPLLRLGMADPVAATDLARTTDENLERLEALYRAWWSCFGTAEATTADAIYQVGRVRKLKNEAGDEEIQRVHDGLYRALISIALGRDRAISPDRLGRYLARQNGRVAAGYIIRRVKQQNRAAVWKMAEI